MQCPPAPRRTLAGEKCEVRGSTRPGEEWRGGVIMSCLLCRCLARPSIVLSGFSRGHDIPLLSAGDGVLGGHSTEGISVCIIVSEPMNAPLAVTSVSLDHHAPFTTSKPLA